MAVVAMLKQNEFVGSGTRGFEESSGGLAALWLLPPSPAVREVAAAHGPRGGGHRGGGGLGGQRGAGWPRHRLG